MKMWRIKNRESWWHYWHNVWSLFQNVELFTFKMFWILYILFVIFSDFNNRNVLVGLNVQFSQWESRIHWFYFKNQSTQFLEKFSRNSLIILTIFNISPISSSPLIRFRLRIPVASFASLLPRRNRKGTVRLRSEQLPPLGHQNAARMLSHRSRLHPGLERHSLPIWNIEFV